MCTHTHTCMCIYMHILMHVNAHTEPKGVILISALNAESQSFNEGIQLLSPINNAFEFKHVNSVCVCLTVKCIFLYVYKR